MAELAQAAAADVYAPRTLQVWRTLLNWLAFFFQIFVQILRGTPSVTQVLSFVGLRHSSFLPSSSPQFKPLSVVELQEPDEAPFQPPPPPSSAVQISHGADERLEKLAVLDPILISLCQSTYEFCDCHFPSVRFVREFNFLGILKFGWIRFI